MRSLAVEKERLSAKTFAPNWIWLEHQSRFNFASRFVSGKNIIDCACGSGVGTNVFSKSGANWISAFDISEKAIQEATEKYKNQNMTFQLSSALNLPIQDETTDLYISLETIEHLKEDDIFLREAKRVLKINGIFICSTPNRRVTNPGKKIGDKPCNKFHIREYAIEEFEFLLKKYFSKVEIYGQNPSFKFKVGLLNAIGKITPMNISVRLHQLIKLLSFFFLKNSSYTVRKMDPKRDYEYLIAVCYK